MELHPVHATKKVITTLGNGLARLAGLEIPQETNEDMTRKEYARAAHEMGVAAMAGRHPSQAGRHRVEERPYRPMAGNLALTIEREAQIAARQDIPVQHTNDI